MRRHIHFAFAAMLLVALAGADNLWARGFGGFHGGGFHGGGFHGGGFHGGGFHGGGLGGLHGGGFHPSAGFHAGGLGGFRPGGFGGVGFGGVHGLNPSGVDFRGLGANRFGAGGFGAGRFDDRGLREEGVGAGRFGADGLGAVGDRLGADGLGGERPPTRSNLDKFLNMPSDAGLHTVSRAADGWDTTRSVARGPYGGLAARGRVEGPRGGEAGRGVAVGPRGNVVGGRYAKGPGGNEVGRGFVDGPRGIRSISAARLNDGATAVRRNFHNYGLYSGDWYRRYPGAWYATGWAAGYAWRAATWDAVDDWFDYDDETPIYYDYGTNVVYQDGDVYVDGDNYATAQQYYDQAQNLASASAEADASADEQWMPLGVFAMTRPDHSSSNLDVQLAVNKAGILRGNFTDTVTQEVKPIHGSVDKKTQRACWTVGKNTETVMETGLDNLTKDEAPALIHFGADRTQQWMLVRMTKDAASTGAPKETPAGAPANGQASP